MLPIEIKRAYDRGENITSMLREYSNSDINTEEIIETAYDLQAGTYVKALEAPEMLRFKKAYGAQIAAEISALTTTTSLMEAGVGEGTTLSFVYNGFQTPPKDCHGFDISWSRIARCRQWLASQNCKNAFLSVASIFQAPYADNSFDVVYTSHTIEPNGGNEQPILAELFRISSRYLILLEPGFEHAGAEARSRMQKLGYCTGLAKHAKALGMKVIKHELFLPTANPLNPTAIIIIEKDPTAAPVQPMLACPSYQTELTDYPHSLYSRESLRAYPKIQSIPCLRRGDGIIASAYEA